MLGLCLVPCLRYFLCSIDLACVWQQGSSIQGDPVVISLQAHLIHHAEQGPSQPSLASRYALIIPAAQNPSHHKRRPKRRKCCPGWMFAGCCSPTCSNAAGPAVLRNQPCTTKQRPRWVAVSLILKLGQGAKPACLQGCCCAKWLRCCEGGLHSQAMSLRAMKKALCLHSRLQSSTVLGKCVR